MNHCIRCAPTKRIRPQIRAYPLCVLSLHTSELVDEMPLDTRVRVAKKKKEAPSLIREAAKPEPTLIKHYLTANDEPLHDIFFTRITGKVPRLPSHIIPSFPVGAAYKLVALRIAIEPPPPASIETPKQPSSCFRILPYVDK